MRGLFANLLFTMMSIIIQGRVLCKVICANIASLGRYGVSKRSIERQNP